MSQYLQETKLLWCQYAFPERGILLAWKKHTFATILLYISDLVQLLQSCICVVVQALYLYLYNCLRICILTK